VARLLLLLLMMMMMMLMMLIMMMICLVFWCLLPLLLFLAFFFRVVYLNMYLYELCWLGLATAIPICFLQDLSYSSESK